MVLSFLFASTKVSAQDIPNYEVITTQGDTFKIYDPIQEGKILITFLFHLKCNDCDWAIQHLVDQYALGKESDGCFEILALDVSGSSAEEINAYSSQRKANFPFGAVADNNWISAYLAGNFGVGLFEAPGLIVYNLNGEEIQKGKSTDVFTPFPFDGLIQSETELDCFEIGEVDVETSIEEFDQVNTIGFLQQGRSAFNLSVSERGVYDIRIFNTLGNLVLEERSPLGLSPQLFTIEMQAGVYVIYLRNGKKTWSTKVYWHE